MVSFSPPPNMYSSQRSHFPGLYVFLKRCRMAWPIERGVHGDLGSGSVDCASARGLGGGGRLLCWCWPGSPLPTCGNLISFKLRMYEYYHYPIKSNYRTTMLTQIDHGSTF